MKMIISKIAIPVIWSILLISCVPKENQKPNVVFVLADQWRAQALGYTGNWQAKTPHLDKLATEAVNFSTTISTCSVCTPARASIITGQYPLSHGLFHNDKPLSNDALSIAEVYKEQGYQTAYIGKWHLNGHANGEDLNEHRLLPVPKERRQGFDYWKVCETTHKYNNSIYYDENDEKHSWKGYDAIAQTDSAISFIKNNKEEPFILFLSWGPPHAPYETAPDRFREMYDPAEMKVRPNVPESKIQKAKQALSGYYAHCSALDDCIGRLQTAIKESELEDNTIFVFTSDHGDMLYSHKQTKKQKPWDESILVPFLLKYPGKLGTRPRKVSTPFSTPDIMPTLLGLSGIDIPSSVEGVSFDPFLLGGEKPDVKAGLITCPVPFHQWKRSIGGKEYRGVRTERYTFVRDLSGPWLLYDNLSDPFQMNNLVNKAESTTLQKELNAELEKLLQQRNDEFREAEYYMEKWDYDWDHDPN